MKDWGGNGRWTCGRKFLGENFRSKMWKKLQKYEPKYKTIIFGQSLARFNVLWFGFETQWLTTLYFISNLVRFNVQKTPWIMIERLSSSVPGWEELQWIPISWSPWSGKNDRISKADFQESEPGLLNSGSGITVRQNILFYNILVVVSLVKFRNILEVNRHWN